MPTFCAFHQSLRESRCAKAMVALPDPPELLVPVGCEPLSLLDPQAEIAPPLTTIAAVKPMHRNRFM
jgi:hypothetical protein